jgi:hypothetical protein
MATNELRPSKCRLANYHPSKCWLSNCQHQYVSIKTSTSRINIHSLTKPIVTCLSPTTCSGHPTPAGGLSGGGQIK